MKKTRICVQDENPCKRTFKRAPAFRFRGVPFVSRVSWRRSVPNLQTSHVPLYTTQPDAKSSAYHGATNCRRVTVPRDTAADRGISRGPHAHPPRSAAPTARSNILLFAALALRAVPPGPGGPAVLLRAVVPLFPLAA